MKPITAASFPQDGIIEFDDGVILQARMRPLLFGEEYTFDVSTLEQFLKVNRLRSQYWHRNGEPWSLGDWGNALGGEVGELQNVLKKIRRIQTSTVGRASEADMGNLVDKAMTEAADALMYLELVVEQLQMLTSKRYVMAPLLLHGINKFNKTSEDMGMPFFIHFVEPEQE